MALGIAFLDLGKVAGLLFVIVEPNAADADTLARFSKIGIAGGAPFFSDSLSEEVRATIAVGVRAGDAEIDRKVAAIGTTVNGWQIVAGAFGDRSRMQNRWLVRAAAARFKSSKRASRLSIPTWSQ